jgi:hypothetical protein
MGRMAVVVVAFLLFSTSQTIGQTPLDPNRPPELLPDQRRAVWEKWTADKKLDREELNELLRIMPLEHKMMVMEVQENLARLGYGVGPFDGVLESATQGAISRYRKVTGLAPGGFDSDLIEQLKKDVLVLDKAQPFLEVASQGV